MAQLVGDAYIRIFGDTSAMRNALHKEERLLEARGEDAADSYLLKFNETIERRAKARMRGTQVAIADAIVSDDFNVLLRKSGQSVDKFAADMREMFEEWNRKDYFGTGATGAHNFRKSLDSLDVWVGKTKITQQIRDTANEAKRMAKAVSDQERAWATYGRNLVATQKLMSGNRTLLHRYGNDLDMVTVRLDKHSNALGRAFGAGSRSELLNFVGRTVGNLARIPAMFIEGGAKAAGFLDEIRGLTAEGTPLIRAFGMTFARALSSILASGAALLIGMAAMSQIIPAVIYLLGLLAGSLVAVIGAIGQGLIGVLLTLGPIALAAGAGIGAVVLGLTGLADASDKAKKRLKPLQDEWARFRKNFREGFVKDITPAISGFVSIIRDTLTPLMDNLSNVLGWLAKRFTTLFNSKEMKPFLDALETSIPHIFQSLGSALIEFGAGLTAFFKPILPYAERLAQKIEDAMQSFREWATSASGQNSIREFMEKAWVAASNLWTIIKNIGSIIWSVFGSGADGPGKDFLGWLAEVTTKWAEFLQSKEGQEKLKSFFRDVRDFMLDVKEVFTIVKEKMDQIDWKQVANDVKTFMDAVAGFFRVTGYVFEQVSGAVNTLRDTLSEEIDIWKERWSEFTSAVSSVPAAIGTALGTVGTYIATPFLVAWAWLQQILQMIVVGVPQWLAGLPMQIQAALSSVVSFFTTPFLLAYNALTGIVSSIVTSVTGWISQLPFNLSSALSTIGAVLSAPFIGARNLLSGILSTIVTGVVGWVAQIPGRVRSALSALAGFFLAPFLAAWTAISGLVSRFPGQVGSIVAGIPGAVRGALAGLVGAFTAPFSAAYQAILGWIETIRRAVNGIVSWAASKLGNIDLNPLSMSGPTGAASFGRGTTQAPTGMRGASDSGGSALSALSALTRSLTVPIQMPQQQQAQRVLNIYPGAIVVQTPVADPEQVAASVVDRIAAKVRF